MRLFQDVSAIEYGDLWEQEITRALNQCCFMIPILTPDFLQSEWCSKEVLHFQEREAALGRDSLIFPIHWVDTGHVTPDGPIKPFDTRVWQRLQASQRVEFDHLSLEAPDSSIRIQTELRILARKIATTLLNTGAKPPSKSAAPTQAPDPIPVPVPAPVSPRFEGPEMVRIPAGSFTMGVPEAEGQRERTTDDDARPLHKVTIAQPFWMGRFPVTRGEYAAFVADTNYDKDGGHWRAPGFDQTDRHPVVNVRPEDADAYAAWLCRKTGQAYRLPSEAEWEYAARAGTTTARFWGEAFAGGEIYVHTEDSTVPVDGRQPNPFGLHDMLGHVWEWCADPWHDNYKGAPTDGSVWSTGGYPASRVARGGSWNINPRLIRAGFRNGIDYHLRLGPWAGFRVVRT